MFFMQYNCHQTDYLQRVIYTSVGQGISIEIHIHNDMHICT